MLVWNLNLSTIVVHCINCFSLQFKQRHDYLIIVRCSSVCHQSDRIPREPIFLSQRQQFILRFSCLRLEFFRRFIYLLRSRGPRLRRNEFLGSGSGYLKSGNFCYVNIYFWIFGQCSRFILTVYFCFRVCTPAANILVKLGRSSSLVIRRDRFTYLFSCLLIIFCGLSTNKCEILGTGRYSPTSFLGSDKLLYSLLTASIVMRCSLRFYAVRVHLTSYLHSFVHIWFVVSVMLT